MKSNGRAWPTISPLGYQKRTAAAFAASLLRLADHLSERRRMGENARKLSETEFGQEGLGDCFFRFLENTFITPLSPDKQPQDGAV